MKLKSTPTCGSAAKTLSRMQCVKDPLLVHRTYDVTTACYRRSGEKNPPIEFSLRGEGEHTLLQIVCAGALLCAGISLVCTVKRMTAAAACRRYYKHKYSERCKAARLCDKLRKSAEACTKAKEHTPCAAAKHPQ